jgi:hypothetical protein
MGNEGIARNNSVVANDNIKLKNTVGCFYRKKAVFNAYFLDDFWVVWTRDA